MSLLDLARLLRRRIAVVLLVAVLTVVAAGAVLVTASGSASIESGLVFEPVEDRGTDVGTSVAVAQKLRSGSIRDDIESLVPGGDYETETQGDFVIIRATARQTVTAIETVEAVIDRLLREVPVVAEQYGRGEDDVRAEVVATPALLAADEATGAIAEASVLVVDPPRATNPLADADYAVQLLLASTQAQLDAGALDLSDTEEVSVTTDYDLPASIIEVGVVADSPAEATQLFDEVLALLRANLEQLQEGTGTRPGSRAGLRPLVADVEPEAAAAAPLRPLIAIVALGGILAVLAALAVDSVAAQRSAGQAADGEDQQERSSEARRDARGS